jgi:low temperature requirement protein LtrA
MEAKQEQRELDELHLIYGHLRDATSIVVTAVRPELTLLHDRLRALPNCVCATVTAGDAAGGDV